MIRRFSFLPKTAVRQTSIPNHLVDQKKRALTGEFLYVTTATNITGLLQLLRLVKTVGESLQLTVVLREWLFLGIAFVVSNHVEVLTPEDLDFNRLTCTQS